MLRFVLREGRRWWLSTAALASGVALTLIVVTLLPGQAQASSGTLPDRPHNLPEESDIELPATVYSLPLSTTSPHNSHYPLCRFGVTVGGNVTAYDVESLNVGWYLNWGTAVSPPQPGGAEYVQLVHLEQVGQSFVFHPTTGTLYAVIDANPGVIWLIGNEQDRRVWQDDLEPEVYARAYHHLYGLIKGRDPSAQIAIGGVVQPTPLRFQYLDLVWDAYWQTYETTMPVDVWNIHSFILREISPSHPQLYQPGYEYWGAGIPRGDVFDDVVEGILYKVSQQDDLTIFRQRIIDFRRWMAEKGERDKPLIVTEYGVLFPEDYSDENGRPLSAERVGTFMQGTFDFFRTYTDPSIGYPADGNRLVQRWAWFSVDADPWLWGGTLFDPNTHALRTVGEYFRDYTNAISPTVDVVAARAFAEPGVAMYAGAPVTATLKALVSNAGNVATAEAITVTFYDAPLGETGATIGEPQVVTQILQGCADHTVVSVTWENLDAGGHPFSIQVQAHDADVDLTNNAAEGVFLVATSQSFLPLVLRSY